VDAGAQWVGGDPQLAVAAVKVAELCGAEGVS
jgi:hypothetical protein